MEQQISYEQLRSLVVDILRQAGEGQISTLAGAVANLARQQGLTPAPNANQSSGAYGPHIIARYDSNARRQDQARVQSILWDLLIEGGCPPRLE